MKPRVIIILLAIAHSLCAEGDTAVDLYAGWSWMPFGYCYHSPYYYGGRYPYWHAWPYAGVAVPLVGGGVPPHGHTGYAPYCGGFEYGVRVRLNDPPAFPDPTDSLLPPLPGSAPLDVRDPQREAAWTREINSLLGSLDPGTNAPSAAPKP